MATRCGWLKVCLPVVTIGDPAKSRVGDWVLAIGNPFGLGGSVTAGIISSLARDIGSGPYDCCAWRGAVGIGDGSYPGGRPAD